MTQLEKIIIKIENDVLTYAEKELLKQSIIEFNELKKSDMPMKWIDVVDEKIKQNQELKEYFKKNPLDLLNESIISLINIAINDLETIRFLYLHELNASPKTCYPNNGENI